MLSKILIFSLLFFPTIILLHAQEQNPPMQTATRPPAGNDRMLRELTPEEIPPNLNFYAVDPLYNPDATLGWAEERIEEKLDRGLLVLPTGDKKVYLSWRLLKSDPEDIAFNIYRTTFGEKSIKLNKDPLKNTTDFTDSNAPLKKQNSWWIKPVLDGRELQATEKSSLEPNAPMIQYKTLRLKNDILSVDRVAVADLNDDGCYDFVIKHPRGSVDPGRNRPSRNSYKIDGYDGKTGKFLWRIDLGWNIDQGIWFSPMVVRDLDGDNKAEVCLRTASYAASREESINKGKGFVLEGPEYLSLYSGETGQKIDHTNWIERGKVQDWGDNSGNRASRHMLGVGYLDGKTPSVLVVRGTYGRMKVDAWLLKNKKLEKVWRWTNERAPFMYQGQGQHSIKTADIDGDGCDEILNGSIAIDNDGRTLWSTGLGHGDRFYLSDIDRARPGLEIWYIIEEPHPQLGAGLWDAHTGDLIFGIREATNDNQLGRALVGDIDATYPGMECAAETYYYTAQGLKLDESAPPQDFLVWWDADLLREICNRGIISKWKGTVLTETSRDVQLTADILGDWREEIVVFSDGELRIYSTVIPALDRRVCLMQDPLYRNDVTHRSMGYPHYPMTSYYLGQ